MFYTFARRGVGRMITVVMVTLAMMTATVVSGGLSAATAAEPALTTTTLTLKPDGTGTVKVTAAGGVTPTNYVDLWIDSVWQKAYTLTDGEVAVDLGTQPHGDHWITVRYRPDSTTQASTANTSWTAPGTIQQPTTTKLTLGPDGKGTVKVTAEGDVKPTNYVDLWIDSVWQKAYTLTDGETAVDLGTQTHGDHWITVRYRPNSTTQASTANTSWTAPGTIQQPTTTKLTLNPDGTGTVKVTVEGGANPNNYVDLSIDSVWQRAYTLTDGEASIDLGTQTHGDHWITVRYRAGSTTQASQADTSWTAPGTIQQPTSTKLTLGPDGKGTIKVTAEGGVTPTNYVDLSIDSVWQRAYTLTDGEASIDLGTQTHGDHWITVRYRPNSTTQASQADTSWTAPGTIQQPTTTKLTLGTDGKGTIKVTAEGGVTPTNYVDLWIDSVWQKAYTLTDGQSAVDLGSQTVGDHWVIVRYRPNSTTQASTANTLWTAPGTSQKPTTTKLTLGPDGKGTIKVTVEGGANPNNYVDLWIDSVWKKAYALTNGEAAVDIGSLPGGDHWITVRYRPNTTSEASADTVPWAVTTDVQVPTTTTLNVLPDGTGTIRVTAGNTVPTNQVDLWVDGKYKRAYTLTGGTAAIALDAVPGGDHQVVARYRPDATTLESVGSAWWTVTTPGMVATTTALTVHPDGTGTIQVTADNKVPSNLVDMWVDGQFKRTFTLSNGKTSFALGTRPGGDIPVVVRYRPSTTDQASQTTEVWSVDSAPVPDQGECGATILKDGGQPWNCTFADDFGGSTLDRSKWLPQEIFGTGANELACYVDTPENISVSEGALHLTLIKGEPKPCAGHNNVVTSYTSGMVTTFHKWSQKYGRIEARVKTTAATVSGLHEAFWLWPDERYAEGQGEWPANGEIDIVETYSKLPGLAIPFLHTVLDSLGSILSGPTANTAQSCQAERGEFNTYTMEWGPDRLEIFINGTSCLVNTSGDEAFNKRYIMAFTQALGPKNNDLTPDTPVPATMSIDYVHAWS